MGNNSEKANKSPKITVIIPILNEEKNLSHVLPKIPSLVDEILIVDGHSTDNTVAVAKKLCPHARIIYQEGKGKGNALRTGFKYSTGDIIITLDADGSMNPGEIPQFVEPLMDDYDFVKGSRFLPGGDTVDASVHRIIGNWVFAKLTNLLHRSRYTDVTYGYNALSRRCLERLELRSWGFTIETEMAIKVKKARLRITEVPSYESARLSGEAKLHSLRDGWRILKTIIGELFHG